MVLLLSPSLFDRLAYFRYSMAILSNQLAVFVVLTEVVVVPVVVDVVAHVVEHHAVPQLGKFCTLSK